MAAPLLGLVLIVRNEAARISDVLASYRPCIDRYTVLDTGSTDGTPELIRRALRNIPGTIREEPFVDFATSRNRALELHGTSTIFSIMPNVDELVGGMALRAFLKTKTTDTAGAYRVRITPGHYYHPLVMRCGAGWRYKWRTHECAMGPAVGPEIPDVHLIRDRGTRTDAEWKQRWTRDLELLHRDRADDPGDPRPYFYLGQTHEGLGQPAEALAFYERRAELGGYFDEVFEAKFRVGKMKALLNRSWGEVQQAYLEAHAYDPRRAEPLFAIADHWHGQSKHVITRIFAKAAAELPKPATDLFLDEDIYSWKAADLASISSFYAGWRDDGRRFADQAVRNRPGDERLRANRAFYARSAVEMFGASTKAVEFTAEPGWYASTPSIARGANGLSCIVRTVNYRIDGGCYVTGEDPIVIRTRNFLLSLDSSLSTTTCAEMIDVTSGPRSSYPIHGFEDCRLFWWKDKWWATATVCDFTDDGKREIALLDIEADGKIVKADALRGPWSARVNKNWMPRISLDEAKLVYSIQPSVTTIDLPDIKWTTSMSLDHGRLRGGSQLVRVEDKWICLVHDVAFPGSGRMYLHRFVQLDDEKIMAMSDPFYFERLGIEFCAGLAPAGDKLVASYSVNDGSAKLAIFNIESVNRSLRVDFVV